MNNLKPDPIDPATFSDAAIAYLASDVEELNRFLGLAGYSTDGLRNALGSSELNTALIHHFAQKEDILLALCANANLNPETVSLWLQKQIASREHFDDEFGSSPF